MEAVLFDFLADPALVDVNVFELSTEFVLLLCDYPHSLLIVTPVIRDRAFSEACYRSFQLQRPYR